MARAKKITKYVLSVKFPDSDDAWKSIWENRQNYTLDQILDLCDKADDFRKTDRKVESTREWYNRKLTERNISESNWRDVDEYGNRQYPIGGLLKAIYPVSEECKKANEQFFAEYNSREDLQELYKKFAPDINWLYTIDGVHHARGQYYRGQEEADKEFWTAFDAAPPDYFCYDKVVNCHTARMFLELNRETPWGAGELVKLRTGYIGHRDYDPMFVSHYNAYKTGQSTPDKTVDRIGTVMKITDTVPWRAAKGSKMIEVLWLGQDQTVHVPEKVLKFETRPTKKNGLVK